VHLKNKKIVGNIGIGQSKFEGDGRSQITSLIRVKELTKPVKIF
jgi:hypothetical protein